MIAIGLTRNIVPFLIFGKGQLDLAQAPTFGTNLPATHREVLTPI